MDATLEVQICVGESDPTLDIQTIVNTNIPAEIFVYKSLVERDPITGCPLTTFCNVASCQQMSEVPANNLEKGNNLVRQNSISLTFSDHAELQTYLDKVCADIDSLLECWNKKIIFTENKFIKTFPTNTSC